MDLDVGQRVVLPKLVGEGLHRRPGTVVAEYKRFYLVRTDIGYNECIFKVTIDADEIKAL